MTVYTKSSARTLSGFSILAAFVRGVQNATAVALTVIRNRAAVKSLGDLDDYLLADIGLTRADLREAASVPLHLDPTLSLAIKVHAGPQAERQMRPRGRRGDGVAPGSLWRSS